jgi:hypothetical protein
MRPRAALAVCIVLAVLQTWPLSTSPASQSLNHNADAQQCAWTIAWIAHILPRNPERLFDGNIFAPEPRTLAYSEPMIVPGLLAAPIHWLGGSPVLAFNLVLIAGLALTAWSAWFVAWKWTGDGRAALVAGALVAFNAHLLTRLPHLMASHAWGLPLAFYFADQLLERRQRRDAVRLAAVVALTAATSLYWLALLSIAIGAVVVAALVQRRLRSALVIAATALGGVVIALPVLWPYLQLALSGATRPISAVAQFSAEPGGYLSSPSRLHRVWTRPFLRDEVNMLFAGFGALILGAIGWIVAVRQGGANRRRAAILAGCAVVGVVLSLGPATAIYRWLYEWLPPLRGLRAAARFGYLYLTAVGLAAGFGVAAIVRHAGTAARGRIIAATALAIVSAEATLAPITTVPFDGVPRLYSLLAKHDGPVMLVEVPFYPPDAVHENGEYELNATGHWRPLMNGTSGFTPMSYRRRAESFWFFPRDWAIDAIKREGATHVMVHPRRFGGEAADVLRAIERRADLYLIGADPDGRRLYEVR